jgi:uncharacterized protein DUF6077
MPGKFNVRLFASLAIPWILVGSLPWAAWLVGLPWLRLALAGLIFVAPGLAISLLLTGNRLTLLSHFTSGVAISVFLVGLLGLIGRLAHLPFEFMKPAYFGAGLAASLALSIQAFSLRQLYKPGNFSFLSISLLLFMIIVGATIALTKRFGVDDFSYLAHLTSWQHSLRLDFSEVVFGKEDLEVPRFWLAMFPMCQAFLAEISNLHGVLLLGYYLGPVLVGVALLATYSLYEDLLQSDRWGATALLFQFAIFCLFLADGRPGHVFFRRITEDKAFAAFALAPVFFLAVGCFLESHTLRRGAFVLLTGWGLALVHPIILAYSIFIAGVYSAIVTISRRDYKTFSVVLAVLVLVLLPSASLRFLPLPDMSTHYAFDLNSALTGPPIGHRISYIRGTRFYGLNLDRIRIPIYRGASSPGAVFLSWSYLWLMGLGCLWSLYELRGKRPAAPFIVASALLVLLCAVPYTGWLVGYFVTARMLWRSPWLFPIGLVGVTLVLGGFNAISSKLASASRREAFTQRASFASILVVCILLISYSMYHYHTPWRALRSLHEYRVRLEEKAALGDYLEASIEQPSVFLATFSMMNYLPGLSSKAKVVFFRNPNFTPYPVDRDELGLVFSADAEVPLEQRMEVLHKYDVQYLLVANTRLAEYYAAYPEFFQIQEVGASRLFEFREMAP